ncbi:O-antigen ligase family protein [Microbacterium sufflavum]|uniref:O-antigen ligase family protein n=1 Tax=Microbacterium sufflavum TaxID=2851649 RepID=A0ABY4IEX2_9MICO|nr:O-antigen ligase family protein [Microbacterium sufflavum]MCK2026500.1 O-antigen ligase family protein [Microbacterium sufflavum]UPL11296.1 O-antigen ligase family protein [Microbacterium sufflavum]
MTAERIARTGPIPGWERDSGSDRASGALTRLAHVIVFALPILAAFGPFIPGVGSLFAFRAAALLLLVLAVLGRKSTVRSAARQSTVVLAAVWMFVTAMSLLAVGPAAESWGELLSLISGIAALLALSLLPSPGRALTLFLRGWLVGYIVISALAVAEMITGSSISASLAQGRTIDGWGLTVVFFNPNNYATYLLYSFLALFALWARVRTKAAKVLCFLALASVPVLMTFTNSRTGVWTAAAFIVVSILLYLRTRRLLRFALVIVTVLAAVLVLDRVEENPIVELADYIGNAGYSIDVLGFQMAVDSSTYVRWELVLAGLALFALRPLLGWGPGAFEGAVVSNGMDTRTLGVISPHNGFIEVLAQYGIFVFAVFVFWLGRMLVVGIRQRKDPDRVVSAGGIVLLIGIASLPVVLTMHSSTLDPSTTWVFFGLLLLIARAAEDRAPLERSLSSGNEGGGS